MEEDKRMSYFCLGLGIGVAVGILFAPKSGEETRQLLRSKADESKDYLRRKSEELKDSAAELADKSKLAIQRQKEQLAAAVDAGRQAYRESITTSTAPDETGA
ncbi:MAG: YtxH domain-containing protein [Acidobacteria bacterium]|nr:YtxH domain-containing protein [Acidobacteriota bacterium]